MSLPKNATIAATPFRISIPDFQLDELRTLIRLSKLPPATYEGTKEEYGVTSKWMADMKSYWEGNFNWREHEAKMNQLPQFTAPVKSKNGTGFTLHFIGVFSEHEDAIPLVLLHGWPGSFIEFLDLIPILAASTSPHFHIIVPSLPGYAFSSPPPLDSDFTFQDCAYLVNELMLGLGLEKYVSQGGDIGSLIAEALAAGYPGCLGCHINMLRISEPPPKHPISSLSSKEKEGLLRGERFNATGSAYALEHATRPSTIGHVLSSSPVALLAWIGEKIRDWTDITPPAEKILEIITLWWFTETMPRSIYAYRQIFIDETRNLEGAALTNTKFGYSNFPKELLPVPKVWVNTLGKMLFYRDHERGGHFAAMEVPEIECTLELLPNQPLCAAHKLSMWSSIYYGAVNVSKAILPTVVNYFTTGGIGAEFQCALIIRNTCEGFHRWW